MKWVIFALLSILAPISARAQDSLPYSVRTQSYNAFNSFAAGDTRTVGMGGATVGLADTFLAAASNPAGLAMTLGELDTNSTNNYIHDGHVQDFSDNIATPTSFGLAYNHYPWGISIGVIPVGQEGQPYLIAGQTANLLTESHEWRVGVGHLLLDDRLSIGVSLNVGLGEEQISVSSLGKQDDRHASAIGATFGSMYKFPNRILLGVSYTLPMHYSIGGPSDEIPGYFQSLDTPSRLEGGLGWIPNRSFRGDLQLSWIGSTPGAALLSSNSTSVGSTATLQPKLGAAYIFTDLRNFQGTLFLGDYYESTRISGTDSRFHETAGLELKPWFATFGVGIDTAPNYRNFLYSVGVDLGFILERLKLVPDFARHYYRGTLPSPIEYSDDDLARPLQRSWSPNEKPPLKPTKLIERFPGRLKQEEHRVKKEIAH